MLSNSMTKNVIISTDRALHYNSDWSDPGRRRL